MKRLLSRISIAVLCFVLGLLVFQTTLIKFRLKSWFYPGLNASLVVAAREGDVKRVKDLFDQGANPNDYYPVGEACDKDYFSDSNVFNDVITFKNIEIVEVFLDEGVDVNLSDEIGKTPLMTATNWKSPEIVALLISNGANVNFKNKDGKTALDVVEDEIRLYEGFIKSPRKSDPIEEYYQSLEKCEKIKQLIIQAGGKKGKD